MVQIEQRGHQRHHVRLVDGTARTDRQGRVLVGLGPHRLGHEQVPRHLFHGLQHLALADAPLPDLLVHHGAALQPIVLG